MAYTQDHRLIAVETAFGPDAVLLTGLTGDEEVSRPFWFTLDLTSDKRVLDPDEVLGKGARVTIALPGGGERIIHGVVSRFTQIGTGTALASYQAELVPWLWMLGLSTDCRIFQQKSVPDIVTQVFTDLGYSDFKLRLLKAYPPREFCVQYRETHLDFVSRLLEDEGIFYYFEHKTDRHTLVLTDTPAMAQPCPGLTRLKPATNAAGEWDADAYTRLTVRRSVHTKSVTLSDYNYLTPSTSLETSLAGHGGNGEAFDYPGGYGDTDEGNRYARLRLEAAEARREVAEGASVAPALTSGSKVDLVGATPANIERTWLVLRVAHTARQGSLVGGDEAAFAYENTFTLVPADVPWRPPHLTLRPQVRGTQSALVVGPAGEEIYTDEHGRVKLHFYWDRESQRDENSSCWVRCSTAWAGRGYGQFSVPRIGQEVLVDFLEGDPDRPVVVGRVFNAEQPPPCDPGGSRGVVSGMRSKSHKGDGFNEMTMDDTAGKEKIAIHAQYDMTTTVQHDDTQTVVSGNRKIDVQSGTHTETIKGDTAITVTTGNHTQTISAGTQTNTVNKKIVIQSQTAEIHVTAATEIKLEVGGSKLLMKSDGSIELSGASVGIKGTAKVAISGGQVSSEAVTTHDTKGAMVMSDGSATNTVKGGMVMLNP